MRNVSWIAAAALLAVACSGVDRSVQPKSLDDCKGPAWTCIRSGPCPLTEFKGMLCAVGVAAGIQSPTLGMEAATAQARNQMGAVVRSRVASFTKMTQESMSKQGQGEEAQKVVAATEYAVNESLSGVSVPRTWFDEDRKMHYALALLDEKTLAGSLKTVGAAQGLTPEARTAIEQSAARVEQEWDADREKLKAP